MITQAIKRWFRNLFAWWPWKQAAMTASVHLRRRGAMFKPQEPLCPVSNDGPLSQAGTTSVAVEQGSDNVSLESCLPHSPPSSECRDGSPFSSTSKEKEYPLFLSPSHHEQTQDNANTSRDDVAEGTTSLTKQQKAFLRYLMRHGLMNEGFEEGHVPEQYRFKG